MTSGDDWLCLQLGALSLKRVQLVSHFLRRRGTRGEPEDQVHYPLYLRLNVRETGTVVRAGPVDLAMHREFTVDHQGACYVAVHIVERYGTVAALLTLPLSRPTP